MSDVGAQRPRALVSVARTAPNPSETRMARDFVPSTNRVLAGNAIGGFFEVVR